MKPEKLLNAVKDNLIIAHDVDDELLLRLIAAALNYAEEYQKVSYSRRRKLPASTEQAVIMLATHFYESRDGSTAGFFADHTSAAQQVWDTINRLLIMEKRWQV